MVPRLPLLTFSDLDMRQPVPRPSRKPTFHDSEMPKKRWYHYLPLAGTVFFMLAPQPSWIYVLVDFHLLTRQQPITFALHLLVSYTLTIMAGSSLVFCVTRDPGTVSTPSLHSGAPRDDRDEEIDLRDALMDDNDNDNDGDDFSSPGRWCRKCWASKPERAHHCSICGRCVLKMDHHCPWLGHNCIGHRTYPAFVHFLFCITCLATYIAIVSIKALIYAFNNPFEVNEYTPVHELILSCAGVIFALVIGSFFLYHVYLISTNQTTLENINPFMILRYLPPLPRTGHSLSDPPLEPELSYKQRSLVRDAHGYIRMYDLGWKRNWSQVFGWNRRYGWVKRLWYGGSSPGNGKQYPRNPKSEELLTRLATELVKLDSTR